MKLTLLMLIFISSLSAHRYYDAATGRFIQIDRYAEKYRSMNPYMGMGNNPLYYTDPTGDTLNVAGMTLNQITEMKQAASRNGYYSFIDDKGNASFITNPFSGRSTGAFANFQLLSGSDIMYKVVNESLPGGVSGRTTTKDGQSVSLILDPSQGANFETLQHEVSHAADFDYGQIWFAKDENGIWRTQNNSYEAEHRAYRSQLIRPNWWADETELNRINANREQIRNLHINVSLETPSDRLNYGSKRGVYRSNSFFTRILKQR